ncbi:MAG: rhodanese-like domain-containing protein [Thaumarchaeota archaeon]|nr:rhodanese-like domain-containing protein [Nitrososphaerota archaeon]
MSSTTNHTTNVDSLRSAIKDKSVRILDVRREDDYKKGHISTAVNLPLASLLADDGPESVLKLLNSNGIADDTDVVIYDDTFGALASRVAWTMEYLGHSNVSLLETTFSRWNELGLETDENTPDVAKADHSITLHNDILATHDYLDSVKGNDGVILIDNRERLNFLEQHIPGAISLPYRMLATQDKILRPRQEMKRLLENRGITGNSEIITYCGSVGTLSGLAYYALKSAGMSDVKLYVRSFREWKNLQKPTAKQNDASYWDLSAE